MRSKASQDLKLVSPKSFSSVIDKCCLKVLAAFLVFFERYPEIGQSGVPVGGMGPP